MKKIKLFDPIIGKEEEKSIIKVLKSGFWASGSGVGNVADFEKKFSKYVNAKNCVAVNSGTAALHLALSLLDIKNKEVILPSLSFVSTAHAVIYNGGIPIFADVDNRSLNLDPSSIEKNITKKTKIIIPVHFGGFPADLEKIRKIAVKNNLEIVEDAAHACGAKFQNKKIGSHSSLVCFSFHPVKNLAMPSGGLIALNHKKIDIRKKQLDSLRWCGISNRKGAKYDVKYLGWNYYMNEFSASMGLEQLKKLNKLNNIRQKISKQYFNELKINNKMPFDRNSVYHFYWILVKNREKFRKKMNKIGIETGMHYFPIHKMKFYKQLKKLENTEFVAKHIVTLPTHPNLKENEVNYIIDSINKDKINMF